MQIKKCEQEIIKFGVWLTGHEQKDNKSNLVEARVSPMLAGWVNVDDKLPELNVGVLCYVELVDLDGDKYYTIAVGQRFINYTGDAIFMPSTSGFIKDSKVISWMPLPEPPKQ